MPECQSERARSDLNSFQKSLKIKISLLVVCFGPAGAERLHVFAEDCGPLGIRHRNEMPLSVDQTPFQTPFQCIRALAAISAACSLGLSCRSPAIPAETVFRVCAERCALAEHNAFNSLICQVGS